MSRSKPVYATPIGGLPDQSSLTTDTAHFTQAYAVIPGSVLRDIVVSYLPYWQGMRAWVLARPLSGFAETFSQMIVELSPGGGSEKPELHPDIEAVLFVTSGQITVTMQNKTYKIAAGGYAFFAPNETWQVHNRNDNAATFHWIRKRYEAVEGIDPPTSFITREQDHPPLPTDPHSTAWTTTRFVDPDDIRHDMHVNIVTFQPGGSIPFAETHVMEHGLFVLQGKATYRLNREWVEVKAGDFIWLRAFCPQACIAAGPETFKYLLYKDVNRHPAMLS